MVAVPDVLYPGYMLQTKYRSRFHEQDRVIFKVNTKGAYPWYLYVLMSDYKSIVCLIQLAQGETG